MADLFTHIPTVQCIICKERFHIDKCFIFVIDDSIRHICKESDEDYDNLGILREYHGFEEEQEYIEYIRFIQGARCKHG